MPDRIDFVLERQQKTLSISEILPNNIDFVNCIRRLSFPQYNKLNNVL